MAVRLHDAAQCSCGAEFTASDSPVLQSSSRLLLCPPCRDAESAESALATRGTLTELVADERGYALHRRTLPGTGTTVDHLFVGAGAVFVINLVTAPGAEVSVSRTRGRFAPGVDELIVGGSRATDLVDALNAQCAEVAAGLADHDHDEVPVIPVLCFAQAHLPRRAKHRRIGKVRLVSALNLAEDLAVEGPFDGDRRFALAMSLVSFLPSPA
jgi:hypothetical protein